MKNKSVKISLHDHILLEELRLIISKRRRIILTKKHLLGWLIKKATEELNKTNIKQQ